MPGRDEEKEEPDEEEGHVEEVPVATIEDGQFTRGVNFGDSNVQLHSGRSCRFPVTALASPWDMDGIKTLALAVSMRVGLAQLLRRFFDMRDGEWVPIE